MTDEDIDDVRLVISLSFRGENGLSDIDLERILSFDMEWLSPEEAEIAVRKLIDAGWLIGERDSLRPAFDARSISTPIGWYPRPSRILEPVGFNELKILFESKTEHKYRKVNQTEKCQFTQQN